MAWLTWFLASCICKGTNATLLKKHSLEYTPGNRGSPDYPIGPKKMVTSQMLRPFLSEYQTLANTNLPLLPRCVIGFFTQGLEMQNSLIATTWIVNKNIAAALKEEWHQALSCWEGTDHDCSGRNPHCWRYTAVRSSNTNNDFFLRNY